MELIIGAVAVAVGGVTWLLIAAEKKQKQRAQRKQRHADLARKTLTSELKRTRSTVSDQMDRTSGTYMKNVKDTLRR